MLESGLCLFSLVCASYTGVLLEGELCWVDSSPLMSVFKESSLRKAVSGTKKKINGNIAPQKMAMK